jgi:AraC family transcriptional regulator
VRLRKLDKRTLVTRAKDHLARVPQMRAGLAQTADVLGVSPSSLAAAFRALERVSFHRYTLNSRLERAAALLPTCNDLTRLAHDLGFASHSHFSTAFHRWAGRTPSAYRAEALQCL